MPRRGSRCLVLGAATAALLVGLLGVTTAKAQTSDPVAATARGDLRAHCLLAETHVAQALHIIQSDAEVDQVRRASQIALEGYLELNRARGAVTVLQFRAKFPDPMLDYMLKVIDEARAATSAGVSRTANAAALELGRAQNIAEAVQFLQRSIALIRRATEFANL